MKKRYSYVLLYGVPALLASIMVSLLLFGATAGFLWIFALGDTPWPSSANNTLTAVFVLAWMTLWVVFMSVAYVVGKKQEEYAALNTKHVMVSAGATAMLLLLVALHQWSVGNIGTKSNGELCSEFCRDKGFASSGMPPRDMGAATCGCFDSQGREALKLPIVDVRAERRK